MLRRPKLLPWRLREVPRALDSRDSAFGRAEVLESEDADGLPIRALLVGDAWESATYLDDGYCELVFAYHRLYNRLFEARPMATHFLMLGGGGFSYPKWLLAHTHDTTVDVVEVDPVIVELARQWFYLGRCQQEYDPREERLAIFEQDALAFLESAEKAYDVVLNDVFAADVAPRDLSEEGTLARIRQVLAPDGLYVANVVSALEGPHDGALRQTVQALSHTFAHVHVIPCSPDRPRRSDNNVVIACDDDVSFTGGITLC